MNDYVEIVPTCGYGLCSATGLYVTTVLIDNGTDWFYEYFCLEHWNGETTRYAVEVNRDDER